MLGNPLLPWGDGGTLTYRQKVADEEAVIWPTNNASLGNFIKHAMMRLDGEEQEEVYVLHLQVTSPIRNIFISQSKPYRLFIDLNEDGQCQKNEITVAQPADNATGHYQREFNNVTIPFQHHEHILTVQADVQLLIYGKSASLYLKGVSSFYEGSLLIEGKEYPARMAFRTLTPRHGMINKVIILDTNRDGKFHYFQDGWFSSQKIGYFNESLLSVTTDFDREQAKVRLEPYTGPTGTLNVKQDNVHRLHMEILDKDNCQFCLPGNSQKSYILPVGTYDIKTAWLSTDQEDIFYEMIQKAWNLGQYSHQGRSSYIRIQESPHAYNLNMGGPVKQSLSARSTHLGTVVFLQYEGHMDNKGNKYVAAHVSDIGKEQRPPAPRWEIRDTTNQVVQSGKFEYG